MSINPGSIPLLLCLLLAIGSPAYGTTGSNAQMEKRMALLDKLDQLDALDFEDFIDSANSCIKRRDFSCAERHIGKAKNVAITGDQRSSLKYALQDLSYERKIQRMERDAEKARRKRIREAEEAEERAIKQEKKRAKKRKARERREAREAREREQEERGREWAESLDNRLNNHMVELGQTLQNSQDVINASYRQSQRKKAEREQERRDDTRRDREQIEKADRERDRELAQREEARQERTRIEQARRDAERRDNERLVLAKRDKERRDKERKDKEREVQKRKGKFQLVVEAAAFCWESKITPNTWKCRGPRHLENSKDSTSFEPDILAQAHSTKCSKASNNSRQAWSTGDKIGYVYLCNAPLRKHDADVMNDYSMPNYIRIKRKVFTCDRPVMRDCNVRTTGMGVVPNWRDIEE